MEIQVVDTHCKSLFNKNTDNNSTINRLILQDFFIVYILFTYKMIKK